MSGWDRIQRLEMDIAQLTVRVHRMDDINAAIQRENDVLTVERDTARRIAMRLEEEVTALAGVRDVRLVPYWGEAT